MPKTLADGKIKISLLTEEPADPYTPTVAELDAGTEASCRILQSDFNVGPTTSETVNEKELCVEGNAVAYGASNAAIEFSPFRYWNMETGAPETSADDVEAGIGDEVFQLVKVKGTVLYAYVRETSKGSREPWAAGDEVNGFKFITDNPQRVDLTGFQKRRVVGGFQDMYLNGEVAETAPAG